MPDYYVVDNLDEILNNFAMSHNIRVKEPHNAGVPHNAGLDIEFHKTHPNHLKLNILVPTYIKTCIEDFLVGIFDHFDLLNV